MDIRSLQNDFYGDTMRWWVGVVIENQDPLRLGRCRVRIYGIHNDDVNEVPQASLPWAQVMVPTTEGGVSGIGRAPGVLPGAQVVGFFMDGIHSQSPLIIGSIPRLESVAPSIPTVSVGDPHVRNTNTNGVTPPNTVSASSAVGSSNTEKGFNFLLAQGFSDVQAAAVLGNFISESGMEPNIESAFPGEESFGIAQWNPASNRRQQLEEFASTRGLDYTVLETQLQFFYYDFSTLSPGFFGYNQFRQMTNINEATDYFCDKYERPAAAHANKPQRRANALRVLETYNGN